MLLNLFRLSILALPLAALASVHNAHLNRHHDIAKRASGHIELHKRFSATRWTFYDVGMGACGKVNIPSDFIVALNSAQFGGGYPGPNCFKSITMTYNGKTTQATIMDECPGCPYGGLDLSRGLFTFFAAESVGVLTGEWSFNGGGGGGGGDSGGDDEPPKTTSTKKTTSVWTPPTSIWVPPTTTSTKKTSTTPKPTTYSTTSTHSTHSTYTSASVSATPTINSTTASVSSASAASGSGAPTSSISSTPDHPENLNELNNLLINLGSLVGLSADIGNDAT